jgi:riboflavin kinase/FMN adenylyltransferase
MFDGVHQGHQAVIKRGVQIAKNSNLTPWIFSFATHPKTHLGQQNQESQQWSGNQLCSLEERLYLLKQQGVEGAYLPAFTPALRNLSPTEFCQHLLKTTLHARILVVGYDFHFGKDRAGSADWLQTHYKALGFDTVIVVPPIQWNNTPISSTYIRQVLKQEGNVSLATTLLERPYSVQATVVKGHQRGGRTLGFPTANLQWCANSHQQALIPAIGVYVGMLYLQQQWFPATINIGISPTFNDTQPTLQIEAHLPTYHDNDFYGETVTVVFLNHLRNEHTFPNLSALKTQISQDVTDTLAYVAEHSTSLCTLLATVPLGNEALL